MVAKSNSALSSSCRFDPDQRATLNDEEKAKYRLVVRGQDRALKGATIPLKISRAVAVAPGTLFDD